MSNLKEYIFNKSEDGKTANIMIDGEISSWWGVGLKDLQKDIANSGADDIMLQINSGGGSVTEGMAISAFIKGIPQNVSTSVIGLAASIATPIALAGKTTSIAKGSLFMIHNASAFVGGEAEDLEKTADLLRKIDKQLVKIYVDVIAKNGKLINGNRKETEEQVTEWQNEETWFTAEESVEHGFIQKVTDGGEFLNKAQAVEIVNTCSRFKNTPAAFLNKVKTIANMSDKKKAEGVFARFLNWAQENPEEIVEPTNEVQEPSKEDKIKAAKELLEAEGLQVNEPVTDEQEDLKTQLAEAQAAKEAAELKAQKLEEEKNGAPSGGQDLTNSKKEENKEKTYQQKVDDVIAKYSDDFTAIAKMLK